MYMYTQTQVHPHTCKKNLRYIQRGRLREWQRGGRENGERVIKDQLNFCGLIGVFQNVLIFDSLSQGYWSRLNLNEGPLYLMVTSNISFCLYCQALTLHGLTSPFISPVLQICIRYCSVLGHYSMTKVILKSFYKFHREGLDMEVVWIALSNNCF